MTVSNALADEAQVIKDTNEALQDIQETLAFSLVDSLKAGDHPDILAPRLNVKDL
ncbi:hypothetical protein GQS40_01770|uniref:Uncharacterized protein n=1 Tax=Leuconostoc lactis TaxID=1246 RepID=A0A6L7AAZ4_LEULA|nr:hypothetical protein [Leuconostoc lactis]